MAALSGEEEKIIYFLQQTADASTVSEIGDKTGIDKRNLHLSLRKLMKKGMVLCTSSKPQKWYITPVNQYVVREVESEVCCRKEIFKKKGDTRDLKDT